MTYDRAANTTLEKISKYGRDITLTISDDDEVYDPATDTFTASGSDDYTVKGLFTNFSKMDIDGELIKRSDKRVLIAASSLSQAPDTDDKITDGTDVFNVINTEELKPGDTPILYMVQVRK